VPHERRLNPTIALVAALALLALACLAALRVGALPLGWGEVWAALVHGEGDAQARLVVLELRLPRIALALLVGGGLGVAGAALQGLFRNPLADPGLIGVSSGAALGAGFVIVLGATLLPGLSSALGGMALPVAAFLGGLAVCVLIYAISAQHGRAGLAVMLLAGVAINAMAFAGLGLFSYIATDEQLRSLTFWNLGSLAAAAWKPLALVAVLVVPAMLWLLRCATSLNLLLLGEAEAYHLGVDVRRLKREVVVCAALIVGALVSLTGMIGFIGLVAPHIARLLMGPDHRVVLPGSVLVGALLVLVADTVARTVVSPAEMPIGIITALIGAPFFLGLLLRERRAWRAA
jgi:iron complex transport system permease protein